MTGTESTGPESSADVPAPGPDQVGTANDASAGSQVTVAPRRRSRRVVGALAAVVVVVGLAVGLVVWAPWTPPPVLRPTGLVVGVSTANSIAFRWSQPATGPQPDKYLILNDGRVAGSVPGTVTSYRQAGLTPASSYQYRVVAVRGGKRSPQSATLAESTLAPPLAQARLRGSWSVHVRYLQRVFGRRSETLLWRVIPSCPVGPCDAIVRVSAHGHLFSVKLNRAGAVYRGQSVVDFTRCGTAGNSIPDPTTLKFRVHATAAAGEGQVWAAVALVGTMTGTFKSVAAASVSCNASTFMTTLSASPR